MDEAKRRTRDEVAELRQEIQQLRADLAARHCCCHHVPVPAVGLYCYRCGLYYTGWHTCYANFINVTSSSSGMIGGS